MRQVIAVALGVAALVLGLICAASLRWYVVDVLIGLSDEADKSMQFWGLAVVFIGVIAGIGAVGLAVVVYRLLSRGRSAASPSGD